MLAHALALALAFALALALDAKLEVFCWNFDLLDFRTHIVDAMATCLCYSQCPLQLALAYLVDRISDLSTPYSLFVPLLCPY